MNAQLFKVLSNVKIWLFASFSSLRLMEKEEGRFFP